MYTSTSCLFSSDRLLRFTWRRLVYLIIAISGLIVTEISTTYYRPFVYRSGIQDWGVANAAGNLFGIIALTYTFMFIAHADRKQGYFWLATQPLGMILYEFIQPLFPWGTFDPMDILATIVGGMVALIIFFVVDFVFSDQSKPTELCPAEKQNKR